jgi:hypothetical protein
LKRHSAAILAVKAAGNNIVVEASQIVDAKIAEHGGDIFYNPSFFKRAATFPLRLTQSFVRSAREFNLTHHDARSA